MRRCAFLLLMLACKEEQPVLKVEPADAALVAVTPEEVKTATTSSATRAEAIPGVQIGHPIAAHKKATATRSAILGRRKQIKDRVRALETRVAQLESTLKVTGPRNDQRDVLAELGRSRGELAGMRSIHLRCENAFAGEEWSEIEAAWLLAEDLRSEREKDAAEENYQRFISLVADFRPHCEVLEPIKGAR